MSETEAPDTNKAEIAREKVRKMNEARARNKAMRDAAQREATERSAADASRVGVAADPRPAQRADATREISYGPEANDVREVLRRRSRFERDTELMTFPEHIKKPGWDYQFIAITVLNQPVDGAILRSFYDQGWRPCLVRDYPSMGLPGTSPDAPVEMLGCRAYERPIHLSMQAKQEDYDWAEQQRRDRTQAAATGVSAKRDEEGIPNRRGIVRVPDGIKVEGGSW